VSCESWGYEPIFFTFIKTLWPQPRKIEEVDPTIPCDREHEAIKDEAKQVEKRFLLSQEDDKILKYWYEINFISMEEYIELSRETQNRQTVIEGDRKAVFKKCSIIFKKATVLWLIVCRMGQRTLILLKVKY